MEIDILNLNDIKPYHRNPREHDDTIEELKKSIKKFGFKVPIVVDEDNTIITGHGRFKAVQELKGELDEDIKVAREEGDELLAENLEKINSGKIHAIIEKGLSEKKKKEYRIVDNKITELSRWDTDLLKFELRELEGAIGFTDEELSVILDDTDIDFEDYGEGEVGEAEKEFKDHYEELSEKKKERKMEFVCPNCMEEFYQDPDAVKRKIERVFG